MLIRIRTVDAIEESRGYDLNQRAFDPYDFGRDTDRGNFTSNMVCLHDATVYLFAGMSDGYFIYHFIFPFTGYFGVRVESGCEHVTAGSR